LLLHTVVPDLLDHPRSTFGPSSEPEMIIIDAGDYRRLSLQQRFPINGARRRYQ
jgi:hypothetical protein